MITTKVYHAAVCIAFKHFSYFPLLSVSEVPGKPGGFSSLGGGTSRCTLSQDEEGEVIIYWCLFLNAAVLLICTKPALFPPPTTSLPLLSISSLFDLMLINEPVLTHSISHSEWPAWICWSWLHRGSLFFFFPNLYFFLLPLSLNSWPQGQKGPVLSEQGSAPKVIHHGFDDLPWLKYLKKSSLVSFEFTDPEVAFLFAQILKSSIGSLFFCSNMNLICILSHSIR